MKKVLLSMFLCLVLAGGASAKDAWDLSSDNDNTDSSTDNALWHTSPPQLHDLENNSGVADEDWYEITLLNRHSYEVQVTNITGDSNIFSDGLKRFSSTDITTPLQTGDLLESGAWMSTLRWIADTSPYESDWQYIQVTSGDVSATSASQYTIKAYDTTMYCPRWNNYGTQGTVLIMQKSGAGTFGYDETTGEAVDTSCTATVYWYCETGGIAATSTVTLEPNNTVVLATPSISGLPGKKGSVQIAHDCGYGGIQAKAVAMEPATGFSFDTICSFLPY